MRRSLLSALLRAALLALLLAGCSYQTAGSPQGGLSLAADFTDVQNLAVGHSVQISNVRVGTVTRIHLVGYGSSYRVRVDMSLRKGLELPAGSTAQLSVTSLLGENFVQLTPGPPGGAALPDHAVLNDSSVVPALEQVIGRAGPLLQALANGDVATITATGSQALGGKGPQLNTMIKQLNTLSGMFAGQRGRLDRAVTDLATLGHSLAAHKDDLAKLPGSLAAATKVLADDRADLLTTISKITDLAKTTDDTVLVGHIDQIRQLIQQLGPVISVLSAKNSNLTGLISTIEAFVTKLPHGVFNGQMLAYPILKLSGIPGADKITLPPQHGASDVLNTINMLLNGGQK